ncbi:MAG: hypothetical protein ACR2PL_01405 [Dehalococcoidia bacterium]
MGLEFLRDHGAKRVASSQPQPPLFDAPEEEGEEAPKNVDTNYEVDSDNDWLARPVTAVSAREIHQWEERPRRFIDGKDVGETVTWLTAPTGHPIPVRLSEIGGVEVRVIDGVCRRVFAVVERVVSMIVDPFPWDEIEEFASALQERGFRLLPAQKPAGRLSYDFEVMRKAAQNRSNTEMGVLEEAALAQDNLVPTVVDGRLEPRSGGLDRAHSPVAGVIKSHSKNYLHEKGLQLLYQLAPGERTPLFALPDANLPVVSWYLRLSPAQDISPNWGLVRVELPLRWFEQRRNNDGFVYVDRLSHLLCEYRCRDTGYARAPVSLHPIVRAEGLLGALFTPNRVLTQRFYRLADI